MDAYQTLLYKLLDILALRYKNICFLMWAEIKVTVTHILILIPHGFLLSYENKIILTALVVVVEK